jgi:hypothetical protein
MIAIAVAVESSNYLLPATSRPRVAPRGRYPPRGSARQRTATWTSPGSHAGASGPCVHEENKSRKEIKRWSWAWWDVAIFRRRFHHIDYSAIYLACHVFEPCCHSGSTPVFSVGCFLCFSAPDTLENSTLACHRYIHGTNPSNEWTTLCPEWRVNGPRWPMGGIADNPWSFWIRLRRDSVAWRDFLLSSSDLIASRLIASILIRDLHLV